MLITPRLQDVLMFGRQRWPEVDFYAEQRQIIQSLTEDDETVVAAAKRMGKDFVAGFVSLAFFLCPQMFFPESYVMEIERRRKPGQPDWQVHTRRVITTSVKADHLDVLWGEMSRFLVTSSVPLLASKGGPLVVNDMEIRLAAEREEVANPLNYLKGMVAKEDVSMAGHHAAYGMFLADEASSLNDANYKQAKGWAHRILMIGNTNDCAPNSFRQAIEESLAAQAA